MNPTLRLLRELQRCGIRLTIDGDKMHVDPPTPEAMTGWLLALLREWKPALCAALRNHSRCPTCGEPWTHRVEDSGDTLAQ